MIWNLGPFQALPVLIETDGNGSDESCSSSTQEAQRVYYDAVFEIKMEIRADMTSWLIRFFALAFVVTLAIAAAAATSIQKTKIELKDGWYYLNGRKFLVNAIGYEPGARPGEDPYRQRVSDLAQIRQDLKNIKSAGFNGIRTWSELSEDELKVVQESGLKILFGIGLKQDEDFSDPEVVERDLALVTKTLAYTRKYDCVITYLIMNEPLPAHLHKVGAQATLDLWTKVRDLIHREHPGIPVTISGNSAITEWVDMNIFDVYSRNGYDYNFGVNWTHGFANAQRFLAEYYGGTKPAMLTEFGRSVSRHGDGLYGGNTLDSQRDAMLKYYRDILDSGATGLCPFYYADGWWKGGEPAIHNDTPEEWFGFWGFKDVNDKAGHPRPAWHALKQYNQALVTSPKNQQFYQNEIPVEAFFQPDVKQFRVIYLDGAVLEAVPDSKGYFSGTIAFAGEDLKDRELVFESYDAQGRLLKIETIIVLTGRDPIQWPTLELHTTTTDLTTAKEVPFELQVTNVEPFALISNVREAFVPHKDWEAGTSRSWKIDPQKKQQGIRDRYLVPDECVMLAIYAGTDIRYGKFVKTIYAQKFLYRGNWADLIRVK